MKTALVARFGVIGDQLVAAAILPGLKKRGFHVTFMSYAPFGAIHLHNPHIDIHRELPHGALGEGGSFLDFWKHIPHAYDTVIHLSESLERTGVYTEDQMQFWWNDTQRRTLSDFSYIERTFDLAGVPFEAPEQLFFPSDQEMKRATESVAGWRGAGPVFGLVAAGSNFDKVHPKLGAIAARLLTEYRDSRLLIFAGNNDRDRELVEKILKATRDAAPEAVGRIRHTMGWDIRQSLTWAQVMDLIVGPDTGLMWSAAFNPGVAQVLLLSHASAKNISLHWRRTTTLHAERARVPCWPCHRLHRRHDTCRVEAETKTAACISSISLDAISAAVASLLNTS